MSEPDNGTVIPVDYETIYRRLHPRTHPFSPYEVQRQLRDLWESDQQRFRDQVDKILGPNND